MSFSELKQTKLEKEFDSLAVSRVIDQQREQVLKVGFDKRLILGMLISIVCYLGMLFWCYSRLTSVRWDYYGFHLSMTSVPDLIASWIPAFLPLLFLRKYKAPSDFCAFYLWITVLCGSVIVFAQMDNLPLIAKYTWLCATALGIIIITIVPRWWLERSGCKRTTDIFKLKDLPSWVIYVTVFASAAIGISMLEKVGFSFNLSMEKEYDRRALARLSVAKGTFLAYLFKLQFSSIIPCIAVIAAAKRSKQLFLYSIILSLIVYAFNGLKGPFVTGIVTFMVYPFFKKSGKSHLVVFAASFVILVFLTAIEYKLFDGWILHDYFIRRGVFIPGLLSSYYLDYYLVNPYQGFGDALSKFGYQMVELPSSSLIGYFYFGNAETNANANIFASGFAEFGYFGMAICIFIASAILCFINQMSLRVESALCCMISLWCGMQWANGALQTSLISGGILFSCFGLSFLNNLHSQGAGDRRSVKKLTRRLPDNLNSSYH